MADGRHLVNRKITISLSLTDRRERWQHAIFRGDRSNRCWDMAFFRFFQDGGRPSSWICDARTHEGHLVVFVTVQNLVQIDTVGSLICNFCKFLIFYELGLKTPIQVPKMVILGDLTSKWGAVLSRPKRHFLARKHVMTYRSSKSDHWCDLCA